VDGDTVKVDSVEGCCLRSKANWYDKAGSPGSAFLLSTFAGKFYFQGAIFTPLFTFAVLHSTLNFDNFGGTYRIGQNMIPKRMFFTKGVGKHKERLTLI